MSRVLFGSNSIAIALAVLATVLSTGAVFAGDAKTVRIVPHAVYGATVSIEAGVRVFRPIPATSHMIVNPNRTPLNLTIKDVTKRVHKTVNHYGQGRTAAAAAGYGYGYGGGFYVPPRSRARRHGGKSHRGRIRRRSGASGR